MVDCILVWFHYKYLLLFQLRRQIYLIRYSCYNILQCVFQQKIEHVVTCLTYKRCISISQLVNSILVLFHKKYLLLSPLSRQMFCLAIAFTIFYNACSNSKIEYVVACLAYKRCISKSQ